MDNFEIIIADDHQLMLDGIVEIVNSVEGFEVIATASNGKVAAQKVRALQPDILLTDLDMPQMNGLELIKALKEEEKTPKMIVLTMYGEKGLIKQARKNGALGFLLKNSDKQEFIDALHRVSEGKQYFSPKLNEDVTRTDGSKETFQTGREIEFTQLEKLTEREKEILKNIARGFSNKEIGDKLFISHRTVDTHRTNLMKKLGVKNIAGLIRFAMENGLA